MNRMTNPMTSSLSSATYTSRPGSSSISSDAWKVRPSDFHGSEVDMISAQARASACPPRRRIKSSGRRALRGDELADRDIADAVIAPGNEPPMVVDLAEMIAAMHGKLDEPVARLERPIADALWVFGIERNVARRCERARDHVQRRVDLAHDLGARHI